MVNVFWGNRLGALNMDSFSLSNLIGAEISSNTWRELVLDVSAVFRVVVGGAELAYDANDQLIGGWVERITAYDPHEPPDEGGMPYYDLRLAINGPGVPASVFTTWLATGDTATAFATILAGDDSIRSDILFLEVGGPDLLRGYAGNDAMEGGFGADTIFGGTGNDTIAGYGGGSSFGAVRSDGGNYLRGDEGADEISGAADFDDINGNQGNDTCFGYAGDDWVVGGKDNDVLFGDAGHDIVYGNLGADTCNGGDGNDVVRGGQDHDVVRGDAGDDFVSGDRGDDTVTGGAGADRFHTFGDAGIDRVSDFRVTEGDRVQLDPGTTYTVAQVGADTVISMTGGGQMILVGVQMSSLTPGWIFGA